MKISMKSRTLVLIIIGVFLAPYICQGLALAAPTPNDEPKNPKVIAVDTKGSGKPDRWEYYENGLPARVEVDRNGDGKIDQIMYYENGKIKKVEKDSRFSGKIDQWIEY